MKTATIRDTNQLDFHLEAVPTPPNIDPRMTTGLLANQHQERKSKCVEGQIVENLKQLEAGRQFVCVCHKWGRPNAPHYV